MAITYRISSQDGLIHARFEGEITLDQLRDYNRTLRSDPQFHPELRELVELIDIRTQLEFRQLAIYQDWYAKLPPIARTAIVAAAPAAYGIARQFQALAADRPERMEVFSDRAAALAWLQGARATPEE